jgi:hypothetical protein
LRAVAFPEATTFPPRVSRARTVPLLVSWVLQLIVVFFLPVSSRPPSDEQSPADTTPPATQPAGPPVAIHPQAIVPSLLKLTSNALKADRKRRVKLSLSCGTGTLACTGTLDVKSASKVRVGKRSKVLTLIAKRRVKLAASKRTTLTLKLSSAARSVLEHHASLTVVATFIPSTGKTVSKRLRLHR